jgi:hypothetical protein
MDGQDGGRSKRCGELAERENGGSAGGVSTRGWCGRCATEPLTADRWGGGARFWTFGILSYRAFAGLYA